MPRWSQAFRFFKFSGFPDFDVSHLHFHFTFPHFASIPDTFRFGFSFATFRFGLLRHIHSFFTTSFSELRLILMLQESDSLQPFETSFDWLTPEQG